MLSERIGLPGPGALLLPVTVTVHEPPAGR